MSKNSKDDLFYEFLDKELKEDTQKQFIDYLHDYPKDIELYIEAKTDLKLMNQAEFKKTPRVLLDQLVFNKKQNKISIDRVILNWVKNGFDILENNLNSFSLDQLEIAYKSSSENKKSILFKSDNIEIQLIPINPEYFDIQITLLNDSLLNEYIDLYLQNEEDKKLIASLKLDSNQKQIKKLNKADYLIEFQENSLKIAIEKA